MTASRSPQVAEEKQNEKGEEDALKAGFIFKYKLSLVYISVSYRFRYIQSVLLVQTVTH